MVRPSTWASIASGTATTRSGDRSRAWRLHNDAAARGAHAGYGKDGVP